MKGSLSLGRIFGINILVHWTFLLIIAWAVFIGWSQGGTTQSVLWTIVFVLSIFFCVVLHELGHALTARRFGIPTRKITLLPIGGVASLERMPEDPKQELIIALMGPVVNIFIAGILYFFIQSQLDIFQRPEEAQAFFQTITPQNFLFYLFLTNIVLVVFNIIPAFPMDGGRVLRALLSFKMDRVRATQIASNMGQFMAIIFFVVGLFYNPILIFIALFVYFGASGEYMMVRQMAILKGHQVSEAMMTNYTVFQPDDNLESIRKALLSGTERHFVVTRNGADVVGILYKQNVIQAFQGQPDGLSVKDIMEKDFKKVSPGDDLSEIYRNVQSFQRDFFPVIENEKLVGVIDMENINEFMMMQAKLDY